MNSFKTEKGTVIPISQIKGKDYLEVKWRLVWFREDHPDWSIQTEYIACGADYATAKATIRDDSGNIIATAHKHETKQGFPDFIEKAETGAVGRALGFIGYGTQFAPEFEEGEERIVDSPVDRGNKVIEKHFGKLADAPPNVPRGTPPPNPDDLGEFIPDVGRFKGKKLKTLKVAEMKGYLEWFYKLGPGAEREPSGAWKEMLEKIEEFTGWLTPPTDSSVPF